MDEDGLQQLLELLEKNFKLLYTVELYGGDVQPAALPLEVQDHTKIECSKCSNVLAKFKFNILKI